MRLEQKAIIDRVSLNQVGATFPGTALPVVYGVAVHHSELAA